MAALEARVVEVMAMGAPVMAVAARVGREAAKAKAN